MHLKMKIMHSKMKIPKSKTIRVAIPLVAGLIFIGFLIYSSNPAKILEAIRTANPHYILLAVPFYPLIMLVYTIRWKAIIAMMGENLPLKEGYEAMVAGAFISDFTPARLGDFLKPEMVKDKIDVGKGLASVIIDHWADALTAVLLGSVGLFGILLGKEGTSFVLFILIPILGLLIFLTGVLLRKDLVMKAVKKINYDKITYMANSFYDAMKHIRSKTELISRALLITCVIWIVYAIRIALLIKALGQEASFLDLIFLLPLVNMLSALPFTIAGLGAVEGGMTLVLVAVGVPSPVAISVAIIDRVLSVFYRSLIGSRYASHIGNK
jgi:uncharacterized protein (TIRG00374 family)